jgi:hypothetical protein
LLRLIIRVAAPVAQRIERRPAEPQVAGSTPVGRGLAAFPTCRLLLGGACIVYDGNTLSFGLFLSPEAAYYRKTIELAQIADEFGLEYIGIQDHPYQPRFLDTLALLTAIAVKTTNIHVFPDVANLPLRMPTMLAKFIASLDVMSGGRAELGLGTGAFVEGIRAFGGPVRSPKEGVDALEEAIQIIRLMWSNTSVRFDGRYYSVLGARPGPKPAHRIGIYVGAYRPRMLRITGRLADGWIPSFSYLAPNALDAAHKLIDEAALEAGRSPSAIRRMYNIWGTFSSSRRGFFDGPPQAWAEDIAFLAIKKHMDTFIFGPSGVDNEEVITFCEEVVPLARELVNKKNM